MKRSRFTETQIISMKVHVIDSGLAATLISLKPEDWSKHSSDFDPILESFIVQQLICQATWQNSEINFSHYRDKDQVEVDLVIEHNREVWGVEVKKTASIRAKDGVGLSRLATEAGKWFRGGMLLYCGNNTLPLRQYNCFAVPMNALWQ